MTEPDKKAQMQSDSLAQLTVLVVNYNSGQWLKRCVETLYDTQAQMPKVLIWDNASSDGSLDELYVLPGVETHVSPKNIGFAAGINALAQMVRTDYLLILNPDGLIRPSAMRRLIQELNTHPNAGLVAGRVFGLNGREQRGSRRQLPNPRRIFEEISGRGPGVDLMAYPAPTDCVEVEAVSGACMMLRTQVFNALGGFDVAYPMHFEDLDLMARVGEAGWQLRLVPDVVIAHAGGVSSNHRAIGVLRDKHRGLWRYLKTHCQDQWPFWSRPLWWLGIQLHLWVMIPVTWWRSR